MTITNEQGQFSSDGLSRLVGLLSNGAAFSVESSLDPDGEPDFKALIYAVKHQDGSSDQGVIKL